MKHGHVICATRLNQNTPVNQHLIELRVDAKAAQKNKTSSKCANNIFYITRFLICEAWKALDQWNRTLFSHRQITSWSLTQDLQSLVWSSVVCLGFTWFAKWEAMYQQSIRWWICNWVFTSVWRGNGEREEAAGGIGKEGRTIFKSFI